MNFNVVLYSNLTSDHERLSHILFGLGVEKEPEQVKIDDKSFYSFFKLSSGFDSIKPA